MEKILRILEPQLKGSLFLAQAPSRLPGGVNYYAYVPPKKLQPKAGFHSLYLLHGRGDDFESWRPMLAKIEDLMRAQELEPHVIILPDAPWKGRGGYYVNSWYSGEEKAFKRAQGAVEDGLIKDLIRDVEFRFSVYSDREARSVGGYSMGGAGAVRYLLEHRNIFSKGLVLSPAIYNALPPESSSARSFGAYGKGEDLFSSQRFKKLNYPTLLKTLSKDAPVRFFIGVGDQEWIEGPQSGYGLKDEALLLSSALSKVGVENVFKVYEGGHSWDVWEPAFLDGAKTLLLPKVLKSSS